MDDFVVSRMAIVRSGDPRPVDVPLGDGCTCGPHCTVLPDITEPDADLHRRSPTSSKIPLQVLERFATIDSMTGIYNRRHFLELADAEWDRFQRYQRPVSLLVFDIDRFKAINDCRTRSSYGRSESDRTRQRDLQRHQAHL